MTETRAKELYPDWPLLSKQKLESYGMQYNELVIQYFKMKIAGLLKEIPNIGILLDDAQERSDAAFLLAKSRED